MATLTATSGTPSLTASTSWSPAQIPANGDTLIISGTAVLNVDADKVFDTITVSGSTAGFNLTTGVTRTLQATNGFFITADRSTPLWAFTGSNATNLTLIGKWNFSAAVVSANWALLVNTSTPGWTVTLRPVNNSTADIVIESAGLVGLINWNTAMTIVGCIKLTNPAMAKNVITTGNPSTSNFVWTAVGQKDLMQGQGAWSLLINAGNATLNFDLDAATISGGGLLNASGGNLYLNGTFRSYALRSGSNAWDYFLQIGGGNVYLNGKIAGYGNKKCILISNSGSGTFYWQNQIVTINADEALAAYNTNATYNFNGLQIENFGQVGIIFGGAASLVANSSTRITNRTTNASAGVTGTESMVGKIINAFSPNFTMPLTSQVLYGIAFGPTGMEQIGAARLFNPTEMAAALASSFTELKGAGWSSSTDTLKAIRSAIFEEGVAVDAFRETALAQLQRKIGPAITVNPVSEDHTITIVIGDDYVTEDGRGIVLQQQISSNELDITGWDIKLHWANGNEAVGIVGSVLVPTGKIAVKLTFTAGITNTWSAGTYGYVVDATSPGPDSRRVSLFDGKLRAVWFRRAT